MSDEYLKCRGKLRGTGCLGGPGGAWGHGWAAHCRAASTTGHQPAPGHQHAAAGHRSGSQETYSPRNALIAGISRTA